MSERRKIHRTDGRVGDIRMNVGRTSCWNLTTREGYVFPGGEVKKIPNLKGQSVKMSAGLVCRKPMWIRGGVP